MATTKKPLRAWLDLRISDDKQGLGRGIERHRKECTDLCVERGYEVIGETVENSVSASKKPSRRGLLDLIQMIENREFDVLVVWAADRLLRRNDDLEKLIDACRNHAVKIVTMGIDMDLSTDAGRLVARILASVARGEIERKAERMRSAFEQSLRDGRPFGGSPRRFGWQPGNVEHDNDEAPILEKYYELWNAGATLGEIVRWSNSLGVITTRGYELTTGSLREILANPANAGLRGTKPLLHDEEGRPLLNANGEQRRSRWHEVLGPATWTGIVSETDWRTAVDRLKDPQRKSGRPNVGRKWLAAGLFRCAVCDRVMKTKTNNQQRSVSCPTKTHATRRADVVEDFVRDVALERLRRDDAADLLRPRTPNVDVRALRDEADAIEERMRAIARDEVLGRRSRDEVLAARAVAKERVDEIEKTLALAGRTDVVAQFLADARDPLEVWNDPATTLAVKQALIDTLMVVRVGSGRIGRPHKYSADEPPPNVNIDWRRS